MRFRYLRLQLCRPQLYLRKFTNSKHRYKFSYRYFAFAKSLTGSIISIPLLLFYIAGCKKDQPVPPINYGYNYFPNNIGHWVVYHCDSIVYDAFNDNIYSYSYYLEEVINSYITDNSGRQTQLVYRYYRDTPTANWQLKKIWTANLTNTDAERVEDNIRYVKLTFPAQMNASEWNGNEFNTLPAWQYQYTAVDVPITLNNIFFDSTLTVLQFSNVNLLQNQFYEEQYARNTGLIYKQIIDLTAPGIDSPMRGGVMYYQTYVASGN